MDFRDACSNNVRLTPRSSNHVKLKILGFGNYSGLKRLGSDNYANKNTFGLTIMSDLSYFGLTWLLDPSILGLTLKKRRMSLTWLSSSDA
jgi:hypothetical protein